MPFLPFIPFLDMAEVVLMATCGGIQVVNTFNMQFTGSITNSDLANLYTAFDTWWQSNMRGGIGDDYHLDNIKVTDMTTVTGAVVQAPPTANPTGAVSGTVAPNNAAMVITSYTALRGRSYHGRNYWPAIPSGSLLTATQLTGAAVAANQAAYNALVTLVNAQNFFPVVASRYNNSTRRTVGVATAITSYVAKSLIGTQRGRMV
jgi:hypothetical protein